MDEADKSELEYSKQCESFINNARNNAAKIPVGQAGVCDICDREFARIVRTSYRGAPVLACAFCRDGLKLG